MILPKFRAVSERRPTMGRENPNDAISNIPSRRLFLSLNQSHWLTVDGPGSSQATYGLCWDL
jgi:hypothetical protein